MIGLADASSSSPRNGPDRGDQDHPVAFRPVDGSLWMRRSCGSMKGSPILMAFVLAPLLFSVA
jgi:hypothetical protein